jgi:hypothetical protein
MSKPGVLPAPAPPAVSSALSALHQSSGSAAAASAGAGTVNGKKLGGKGAMKTGAGADEPKKKRRRQSAPAKALGMTGVASRANSSNSLSSVDGNEGLALGGGPAIATALAGVTVAAGGRKKRASAGLGKVDEVDEKA